MRSESARARERRVALPWRIVFIIYAVAMTTGTHWPRLDLSVGDVRAPDKILHMVGFGGLVFLLSRTRWIARRRTLLLVALGWALLDELTQALPILGRTFSWLDVLAGSLGIVLVMIWLWALGPIGGPLNRLRQGCAEFVIDEMAMKWRTWIFTGFASLIGAAIMGTITGFILWRFHPATTYAAIVAGILAGGIAGAHGMIETLWRRERERIAPRRPCLACGEPLGEAEVDEHGRGRCPTCGEGFHFLQWTLRAELSRPTTMRLARKAAIVAFLLGLGAILIYALGLLAWGRLPSGVRGALLGTRLPADLRLAIDTFLLGVILAIAARVFRLGAARRVDGQGRLCRACGHDLRATPAARGAGVCGECGLAFARADETQRTQRAQSSIESEVDSPRRSRRAD